MQKMIDAAGGAEPERDAATARIFSAAAVRAGRVLRESGWTGQSVPARPEGLAPAADGAVPERSGAMDKQAAFVSLDGTRQVAAIVFTDAANSCSSMGQAERETVLNLERDFRVMSQICARLGGRIIKTTGDGLLLSFPSALAAVRFAVRSQQHFAYPSAVSPAPRRLQHRIAVHLGDVLVSRTDIMGEGVNIAARVLSETEPGGICITQVVYDLVRKRLALRTDCLGVRELRNIEERIGIYRVLLEARTPARFPALARLASAMRRPFRGSRGSGALAGLSLASLAAAALVAGACWQLSQVRARASLPPRPPLRIHAQPQPRAAPHATDSGRRDSRPVRPLPVRPPVRRPDRS